MGIQGLIPLLKSIQKPVQISKYAGQPVAVDGHCWLHRGTFSCASELARGIETNAYVDFFMNLVKMLLFYKVVPIIVFDGQSLPIKQVTRDARATFRKTKLEEGQELLKVGKITEANKCFQQAVSITPDMVANVIKELDRHKVQHVVAPYEADPQLAYLLKEGQVNAVITEDSDLLAFGCSNIIFKMDRGGDGVEIATDDIFKKVVGISNLEKLRYMCILSGCDYLPSLPGIGLRKAQDIVKERKTIEDIMMVIQNRLEKGIASEYQDRFFKANAAFLYQFVFDPNSLTYVRLNELPKHIKIDYLSGLGESPQNKTIDILKSNNAIYLDYERLLKEANKENIDPFAQLDESEFNELEFDDKALKAMGALLEKVEPAKPMPKSLPKSKLFSSSASSISSSSSSSLSPLKSLTNVNSLSSRSSTSCRTPPPPPPSVSVNTPARLSALIKPTVNKLEVWRDKKKPRSFFSCLPSPSPPPSSTTTTTTTTHAKYPPPPPVQKRKSLWDENAGPPLVKVKRPSVFSDASIIRQSICKK